MADEKRKHDTWHKILYKDQGVPDYYVDDSFLDELKKNCNLFSFIQPIKDKKYLFSNRAIGLLNIFSKNICLEV